MDLLLFSERSIWTMVHGIALGGGALMALFAALYSLHAMGTDGVSDAEMGRQARKLAQLTVIIAILLWLTVRADVPKQARFTNIPVEVDLRDPDWRLDDEPIPSSVTVVVVGPTPELMELTSNPPRIGLAAHCTSDGGALSGTQLRGGARH
mgnify:CR=1 FL=1